MGLFAALSAGVSGLDSQSNKIGIISNNVANVNTIGFKQSQAAFDTLVVPSGTTSFSPGGVIGNTQQLVNQQGTISASSSATDVAISGAGFFVVNTAADGAGNTYYTRAGSFTQDSSGNFINADGYYLEGLPINGQGQTAEPNAQNLETVTVSQSATGSATQTSSLAIVANLDATQTVLPGSSATATLSSANNTSPVNVGATANQIIVGNNYGATPGGNNLLRGDTLNIASNSGAVTDTFTYGGYTVGRNISDSTLAGDGDGGNLLVTDTPNAGFSTYHATAFTPDSANLSNINASATVLTVNDDSFTAGATTLTIGGATVNLTANATGTPAVNYINYGANGTAPATTLAAIAAYLNTPAGQTAIGSSNALYGSTFTSDGTHIYASNPTNAAVTSGVTTNLVNGGTNTDTISTPNTAIVSSAPAVLTVPTAATNTFSTSTTLTVGSINLTFADNATNTGSGTSGVIALGTLGSLSNNAVLTNIANYLGANQTSTGFGTNVSFSVTTNGGTEELIATNGATTPSTASAVTFTASAPASATGFTSAAIGADQSSILSISGTGTATIANGTVFNIGGEAITVIPSTATPVGPEIQNGTNSQVLSNLMTYLNTNTASLSSPLTNLSFTSDATNLYVNNNTLNAITPTVTTGTTSGTSAVTGATVVTSAGLPAPTQIGSFANGPIVAGDSINVDGQTFNFVATGGNGTSNIDIGATTSATLNSLVSALNTNTTLNPTGDGFVFSTDGTSLYAQDNKGVTGNITTLTYTPATSIASTTYSAITGFNVASTTASAVGGTGQLAGNGDTLTVGNAASITLTAGESLATIAADLQTNLRALTGGANSTVTITGNANNYSLTVADMSGSGNPGFTGTAITQASLPTFTVVAPDNTPLPSQLSIAVQSAGDYTLGQDVNISGVTSAIGGIPAADINGELKVVGIDTANNTIIVAVPNTTGATSVVSNVSGGTNVLVTNRSYPFTGNILNATSATDDFLTTGSAPLTATDFASDAMHFTVSVNSGTPQVFTYSSTPDPTNGTFNNLTTLAEAISDGQGLTATVADGRLYVSATNANDSLSFANGDGVGNGTLPGINWVQELDLQNLPAAPTSGTGSNVFNSLQGLANVIKAVDPTNLTATVTNPDASSTLTITEANPEQTIQFSDGQAGGSILKELGFANVSPVSGSTAPYTTGPLGITYSPTASATDMSSGAVTPQFSHDVTVYDAQGNSHTLALNFVKLATNTWGVELTAVPASDVNSTTADGQLANGTITFNGSGGISSVTGTIGSTVAVNWTNGAAPSQIAINLGLGAASAETADLTQSAGAFNVSQANQNGSPTGELTGVSIDENGFVIANFSNGQTQKLYQLPLASVNNPDGLESVSGNAYQQTLASGIANLQLAGTSGVGTFTPSALEQSNVDLSTQLTDLIVAQQAYGANSKLLTVADTLLQELDQIIQ